MDSEDQYLRFRLTHLIIASCLCRRRAAKLPRPNHCHYSRYHGYSMSPSYQSIQGTRLLTISRLSGPNGAPEPGMVATESIPSLSCLETQTEATWAATLGPSRPRQTTRSTPSLAESTLGATPSTRCRTTASAAHPRARTFFCRDRLSSMFTPDVP